MNKTEKKIFIIILIGIVYTFIIGIIAVKQHYKIKDLQDNIIDNQSVIAGYKQDIESKEYKAVKKCTSQKVWVKECIEWEFDNANF